MHVRHSLKAMCFLCAVLSGCAQNGSLDYNSYDLRNLPRVESFGVAERKSIDLALVLLGTLEEETFDPGWTIQTHNCEERLEARGSDCSYMAVLWKSADCAKPFLVFEDCQQDYCGYRLEPILEDNSC